MGKKEPPFKELLKRIKQKMENILELMEKPSSNENIEYKQLMDELMAIIPPGSQLTDKKEIIDFIEMINRNKERLLENKAKIFGIALLDALMYIHGVTQTSYVTNWRYWAAGRINSKDYEPSEMPRLRRLNNLYSNIDRITLSAIEFLLNKCLSDIIKTKNTENLSISVVNFIERYENFLTEQIQLAWLQSNFLKDARIIFLNTLTYYFPLVLDAEPLTSYSMATIEANLTQDINSPSKLFTNLIADYSILDDIWKKKFGYTATDMINVAKIISDGYDNCFREYFEAFQGKLPVFNFKSWEDKHLKNFEKILRGYLVILTDKYTQLTNPSSHIITKKEIEQKILKGLPTLSETEVKKILSDFTLTPKIPFHPAINNLANHFFYEIGPNEYFFLLNNPLGILEERLQIMLTEIPNAEKEYILLTPIKRIIADNNYAINPLSGKQMIDEKGRTIGEIDVVATKEQKIIFVESKIIPQKKIGFHNAKNIQPILKKFEKHIKKFDKNITLFESLCQSPERFEENQEKDTIDLTKYKIVKYFFISPYPIFDPTPSVELDHPINILSLYMLQTRLQLL